MKLTLIRSLLLAIAGLGSIALGIVTLTKDSGFSYHSSSNSNSVHFPNQEKARMLTNNLSERQLAENAWYERQGKLIDAINSQSAQYSKRTDILKLGQASLLLVGGVVLLTFSFPAPMK